MKLVPINMEYCLLQFDTLKFFLAIRLHGEWGVFLSCSVKGPMFVARHGFQLSVVDFLYT